jgi:dCMP deaminase
MKVTGRWLAYFFALCQVNAAMSKDPSTKVGAVIVKPDKTIAGMGWNGFPRGITDAPEDYADRDTKYSMTIHAEVNAVLSSGDVSNCILFVHPFPPCDRCAAMLIQAGISAVVCPPLPASASDRWAEAVDRAMGMFAEAGVDVHIMDAFASSAAH